MATPDRSRGSRPARPSWQACACGRPSGGRQPLRRWSTGTAPAGAPPGTPKMLTERGAGGRRTALWWQRDRAGAICPRPPATQPPAAPTPPPHPGPRGPWRSQPAGILSGLPAGAQPHARGEQTCQPRGAHLEAPRTPGLPRRPGPDPDPVAGCQRQAGRRTESEALTPSPGFDREDGPTYQGWGAGNFLAWDLNPWRSRHWELAFLRRSLLSQDWHVFPNVYHVRPSSDLWN